MAPLASIIIRTRNEETWISKCLKAVYSQTIKSIEVIIVDNNSIDSTLARARQFPVKIVHQEVFLPRKALNH